MPQTKAHTEYLTLNTRERYEMVHITPQVEEIVRRSGIDDGLCFVSPMHITAAIYVNDHEDGLNRPCLSTARNRYSSGRRHSHTSRPLATRSHGTSWYQRTRFSS
ncbi:uncharacterized protein UPF0047 [Edaphobacter modestus]|uniref:Uncharacterized protein UPF0047 n=1 Tax=Edaphobacter modestus TaxID=388466 RepID=A0A4Q7YQ03_9BACT|nr:uncharacterized protein UPF0047 [Edaphobacter modestus]